MRRKLPWKIVSGLLALLLLVSSLVACDANDPLTDPLYTNDIFSGAAGGFDIGTPGNPYANLYVTELHANLVSYSAPTELTIAAGEVTVTGSTHTIDTEGDAPTDFLDTINGGSVGDVLVIEPDNSAREIVVRAGVGNIRFDPQTLIGSYGFSSPSGTSGLFYAAGFYRASATDVALTQASTTVSFGTADVAYGAHAFIVAAGPGATDAGTVSIIVSGTSITDGGVRTAGDSETIVADVTSLALDDYAETPKKWIGSVVFTLTPAGGAAVFSATVNYGIAKYEDFGNRIFHLTGLDIVGRAGGNDSGFNIRLFHHSAADWTYSAAGFVPGGTVLADMNVDYVTETELRNTQPFSYKRADLSTTVEGALEEGLVVEITTTTSRAVDRMDIHIQGHVTPDRWNLTSSSEALRLIFDGTNWINN